MHATLLPRLALAAALGLMLCGAARADDTPPTLTGAKLVTAEDVAKAAAGGAMLLDARVAAEYADGHIKGAVSVPYREKSDKAVNFDAGQDEFNLSKLPADKAAPVVVYCNGPECWKSYKASFLAIKAGYSNILWYRDGYPNWKSKGMPTE
jgi:rhodanese-related sulfurtransferase